MEGDEESRIDRRETDWKLDPVIFKAVQVKLGASDDVDLFASRANSQLDGLLHCNQIQVHGRWMLSSLTVE